MTVTKVVEQNFEMFSGDSKLLNVTVLDQDGTVVDLTGASASMTISETSKSAALVTKAGSIDVPLQGQLSFDLAPADTDDLAGVYYYEMQVTDVSGRKSTVAFGYVTIRRDVAA